MQYGHLAGGASHADDETIAMKRRRQQGTEEITARLREIGDMVGQGMLMSEAIRRAGVAGSTYYQWRANHQAQAAQVDRDQAQRIQTLMVENTRLRQAVADLMIERQALKEATVERV